MQTIAFEGAGDDLIGVSGLVQSYNSEKVIPEEEFDACASEGKINARFRICPVDARDARPEERGEPEMMVYAHYGESWVFAVGQAWGTGSEPDPLPEWPVRTTQGSREYTTRLEVDAPDGYCAVRLD